MKTGSIFNRHLNNSTILHVIPWNSHYVGILTHWGRVTHICVGKLTIIGSDNGLSPERRQAIIWTNAGILLIGPLGTNFREILIEIQTFLLKKIRLKMPSAKCGSFHLGLNVLRHCLLTGGSRLWWFWQVRPQSVLWVVNYDHHLSDEHPSQHIDETNLCNLCRPMWSNHGTYRESVYKSNLSLTQECSCDVNKGVCYVSVCVVAHVSKIQVILWIKYDKFHKMKPESFKYMNQIKVCTIRKARAQVSLQWNRRDDN